MRWGMCMCNVFTRSEPRWSRAQQWGPFVLRASESLELRWPWKPFTSPESLPWTSRWGFLESKRSSMLLRTSGTVYNYRDFFFFFVPSPRWMEEQKKNLFFLSFRSSDKLCPFVSNLLMPDRIKCHLLDWMKAILMFDTCCQTSLFF